jgi:hypothetical protein
MKDKLIRCTLCPEELVTPEIFEKPYTAEEIG